VQRFHAHCKANGAAAPSVKDVEQWIDTDPTKISWNRADKTRLAKGEKYVFDAACVVTSSYRPFTKQKLYFNSRLNDMTYRLPRLFPTVDHENFGFYVNGLGLEQPFTALMVGDIPNLNFFAKAGVFFPRYAYRELIVEGGFDLSDGDRYERVDNITDAALAAYRKTYGSAITKDDIFNYIYALLHSPEYRERFASDLKKSLPRIPKVRDFRGFAEAGQKLSDLHINYEQAQPYKGIVEKAIGDASATPPSVLYRVVKMKIPKVKGQPDRSIIVYNSRVTLTNIPEEAYRYQLGARSAIEWIIDRYQVEVDKASEIVNDPNDWSDDPRYIIDLLKRIVTVSLETMKIVDSLPGLDILE
jgi:predicted helicase